MTESYFEALEQSWACAEKAMENLEEVIRSSLRRGDAAAKCTSSQYIIMLPSEPDILVHLIFGIYTIVCVANAYVHVRKLYREQQA